MTTCVLVPHYHLSVFLVHNHMIDPRGKSDDSHMDTHTHTVVVMQ